MTNGGPTGTGGETRFGLLLQGLMFGGAATSAVISLNITSKLMENGALARPQPGWRPWVDELTSAVAVIALGALVYWAFRRWPPWLEGSAHGPRWRSLAPHIAMTIPYCLLHVGVMAALRAAVYPAFGASYSFADSGSSLGLALFYEWRKDALTYAAWLGLYWVLWRFAAHARHRKGDANDAVLAFKDGARTHLAPLRDIYWIEAAGNYVEAHLAARTLMTRATLAAIARQLEGSGFVQVHRSRLVNLAHVRSVAAKPSGDLTLTFDDGRSVQASRRYREALAAFTTPAAASPPYG